MKTTASVLFRIVCTMIFVWPGLSFSQEQANARLQTELVSPWLVTVQGQDRPRTLSITGVRQDPGGKLLLDAAFGWADGNQVPVPTASVIQSGQETRLLFVTQAGTQVAVVLMSSGVFEGTFTTNDGVVKTVRIQKHTEDELRAKIAATKAARAAKIVVQPSTDVPESCAAFSGQWAVCPLANGDAVITQQYSATGNTDVSFEPRGSSSPHRYFIGNEGHRYLLNQDNSIHATYADNGGTVIFDRGKEIPPERRFVRFPGIMEQPPHFSAGLDDGGDPILSRELTL